MLETSEANGGGLAGAIGSMNALVARSLEEGGGGGGAPEEETTLGHLELACI